MGDSTERIDALDSEVGRFVRDQLKREGVVTGWVLTIATNRFDDDGDTCYGWDYVIGPQTSFPVSVGLAHTLQIALDQKIWQAEPDSS